MIREIAQFLTAVCLIILSSSTDLNNASDGICAENIVCDEKCTNILKMFLRESPQSAWASRYDSIAKKFVEHNVAVSVEIGVGRGELSHYLLKHVKDLRVHHGVDPFAGGINFRTNFRSLSKVMKNVANRRASVDWGLAVLTHLKEFGCRFRLHKGYSRQMASHFLLHSIDCVLFDGDHSYNGIITDVINYVSSVRPGGLLIFDDYNNEDFPGVQKAVDELSVMNDIPIISINEFGNVMLVKPLDKPFRTSFDAFDAPKARTHHIIK